MSQENVEVVRQLLAAASRGDLEAVIALHQPDWEGFIPEEYPVAGRWRGLDGLRKFVQEWLDAFEEFRVEPEEFMTKMTLCSVRYWGRGRGSGATVTDHWTYAYRLRDGKVFRWRLYRSRAEALKAVGLSE